jgi:rhombotail lipoprotein
MTNRSISLTRLLRSAAIAIALAAAVGCASLLDDNAQQRQVASLLAYLYPDQSKLDQQAPPGVAELHVPFRLGLAFVPDTADTRFRLSETDRLQLLDQVRRSFRGYPFIQDIEVVPSHYLVPGGGHDNLRQVAQLLRLDVLALVSYDQVQNAGASRWSFLYWTGVGAYVIEGDRYDILTMVEAAVIDVKSRRLLMRATGTSRSKGSATLVSFDEKSRSARTVGFDRQSGS